MKRFLTLFVALLVLLPGFLAAEGAAEKGLEKTKLIYMTAGDVNMLALGQNVLGPQFSQKYPNIELMTIHTGPGNAGSQRIYEKVLAEKNSGKDTWDVDVAMVHQIFMKWALQDDLLLQYAGDLETWKYITSPLCEKVAGG